MPRGTLDLVDMDNKVSSHFKYHVTVGLLKLNVLNCNWFSLSLLLNIVIMSCGI